MHYIAIVTLLTLMVYMWTTGRVGAARARLKFDGPRTTGNEEFERFFRVQQNTLEQLPVFIPALWIFGSEVDSTLGAAVGLVFIVGRILYALAYVRKPSSRALGFVIGFLANVVLILGSLGTLVMKLL